METQLVSEWLGATLMWTLAAVLTLGFFAWLWWDTRKPPDAPA